MKKTALFKLTLFTLLLFLCSAPFFSQSVFATAEDEEHISIHFTEEELAYLDRAEEITIGCPVNRCPLLFQNEKTGELEGITIDILNLISEATGLTFHYEALPSGEITYKTLQQLQVDMVAGVELHGINQASKGIVLTDAYLHAEKVFVCKKGVIFRPDSPMVIAIDTGSQTLAKIIRQQYPEFQVLHCDSMEDALSALLTGKADAVLQNQYTLERILSKPLYEDLQIVASASIGDSQCLACLIPIDENGQSVISDDITLLLSVINKGIACLDQSQVSFFIIRETAENAYQFTMWDILYRYRFLLIILFITLLLIMDLLRRIHLLKVKHTEQQAAQQRAQELAAINERMKEQQLLLIDSLKHAEEGNRAKTTFLFNMSHDIRTPMNAILGFTEIALRSTHDSARVTDCLEKIQLSGRHLLQLINDVLDMAKIEEGKVTLTEECCNLEECIQKARDILQVNMDKKHLTFQSDTSAVANKWVYCDSLRINQILFNLLSNAVKFNRTGGSILVTLRQNLCDIPEYAAYEIRVKDTGLGMSPEFLSHVFEPFEREHTSTISQTQGTGLGMSITKNLVDLMGGTIQVSSVPGRGTEFVLQFTFQLLEQVQAPEGQTIPDEQLIPEGPFSEAAHLEEPAPADEFSSKRLLLVEDNELNMEIARELLCCVGFLVETAQNGQIAVEMVRNSTAGYYSAILMDIQMPVMDGYQASREIRRLENKDLSDIPIIALTANAFDKDKKEALANGMNAHIAKPINAPVLYETLANILKNR